MEYPNKIAMATTQSCRKMKVRPLLVASNAISSRSATRHCLSYALPWLIRVLRRNVFDFHAGDVGHGDGTIMVRARAPCSCPWMAHQGIWGQGVEEDTSPYASLPRHPTVLKHQRSHLWVCTYLHLPMTYHELFWCETKLILPHAMKLIAVSHV